MERIVLTGQVRTETGTRAVNRLRRAGFTPAILYGHGEGTTSIQVDSRQLSRLIFDGHHMVTLDLGGKQDEGVLREIQMDSMGQEIIHVDFARIDLDEVIEMLVLIVAEGNAKGAGSGGIIEMVRPSVTVKGKARDIPESITLDVTELGLSDSIKVQDLKLAEGLEIMADPVSPVIICQPPRGVSLDEDGEEAEGGEEAADEAT